MNTMELQRRVLTEDMAKEIAAWEYSGDYSAYNPPSWEEMSKLKFGITREEVREKEFIGLLDNDDNFIGHIRLREDEEGIKIGLGLKPSLCGQGLGKKVMEVLKDECFKRYGDKSIILDVRTFNKRAIKTYERAGFKVIKTFERKTKMGQDEFYRMRYDRI